MHSRSLSFFFLAAAAAAEAVLLKQRLSLSLSLCTTVQMLTSQELGASQVCWTLLLF
jgi:hypothetical protein